MRVFSAITGLAAAGLIWTAAGAASAQELQPGEMMTQAEADRLEAVEADNDRTAAEIADLERELNDRDRQRRRASERETADRNRRIDDVYRRQREAFELSEEKQAELDDLSRELDEMERNTRREEERYRAERDAACRAEVDPQREIVINHTRKTYNDMISEIRRNPSTGAAEAIRGLEAQRDSTIAMLSGQGCETDDDLLAPLTPDEDLLAPLTPRS